MSEQQEHQHCWHMTGNMFLTLPPIVELKCCHCGEIKEDQEKTLDRNRHGPYIPVRELNGDRVYLLASDVIGLSDFIIDTVGDILRKAATHE